MKTYNFKYGHGSVSLSLNEADILAERMEQRRHPSATSVLPCSPRWSSPSTARLCASGSAPEIGWRW